jgi:hypothetical protein
MVAVRADFSRALVAITANSGERQWVDPLSGPFHRRLIGDIEVWGSDILAVTPDGSGIFLSYARKNAEEGVAVLRLPNRDEAVYAGPYFVRAGVTIAPPSARFPIGAVGIGATRTKLSGDTVRHVFLLDPRSLAVIDSIPANILGATSDLIEQVLLSRDGEVLIFRTRNRVKRFALEAALITADVPAPSRGALVLSSDERSVVVMDPGLGSFLPGSGKVFVLDGTTLGTRAAIQLPLGAGGYGRPSWNATIGSAMSSMYVITGTAGIGPYSEPQSSALVQIDLSSLTAVRVIELNDVGAGPAFSFW